MADLNDAKKAVSTVDLVLQAIGLLKTGAIIFGMVLIDWARRKQKLAENQAEVAKTDLDVMYIKTQLQKEADAKTPDAIIDDFLRK